MVQARQGDAWRRIGTHSVCSYVCLSLQPDAWQRRNVLSVALLLCAGARREVAVEQVFKGKKTNNMKKHFCFLIANGLWLMAALSQPLVVSAADDTVKDVSNTMEVLCLSEQPAIVEGESPRLRAWATTPDGKPIEQPVKFDWRVTEGLIQGTGADVRWDLSAVNIESNELHKKLVAT